MDLGDFNSAIYDFEESSKIEENNITSIFSIGECYYKLGKFKKAIVYFELALELEPNDELSKEWLIKSLKKLKN